MGGRRLVAVTLACVVAAGCSAVSPPRAGGDAGSLDDVAAPTTPVPGTTTGPTSGPEPAPSPTSPSASPSEPPSELPTDQPSPTPTSPDDQPSATEPPPDVVPDLDPDGWQVRVVGLVDPARADVLNEFAARPVVAVLHVQADELPEGGDADAESVVSRLDVRAELDDGQRLSSLPAISGATTVECPEHVESRVVLRPGQGQRLCVVFDVPGDRDVAAVHLTAAGQQARVEASLWEDLERIDDVSSLDVGVPAGVLALGEAATVTVPVVGGDGTAEIDMAVSDVTISEAEQQRVVEMTVTLASSSDLQLERLATDAIAAISQSGVQRGRRLDVATGSCTGSTAVEVPAGEEVTFCVPVRVPEATITTNARYTTEDGPPVVWRVLQAGGTAGPGSNA